MQIAYHIGANCTDNDLMMKSLLKNAEGLAFDEILVPRPGMYRNLIRETIQGLHGRMPRPDAREILVDAIVEDDEPKRLVLSNSKFICVVKRIFENRQFYHLIDEKVGGMRDLFPEDDIEYFMGMRNPATFIPAVFAEQDDYDLTQFLRKLDPLTIRWSDAVARICEADDKARVTVWCDEDTPFIWAQLIRLITGVDQSTRIAGGFDMLQSLMTTDGMKRFVAYMKSNPPQTEQQKRRVIGSYLEKYADPELIEQEIDLPGWDQGLLDELTRRYEDDMAIVARLPGVRLIRV